MPVFTTSERSKLQEVRGLWEAKFKHTRNKLKIQRSKTKAAKKFIQRTKRTTVATSAAVSPKEAAAFKAIENAFYSAESTQALPDIGALPGWAERGEFTSGWLLDLEIVQNARYWMKQEHQPQDDAGVERALLKLVKRKVLERRIHDDQSAPGGDTTGVVADPGIYYRLLQK